MSRNPSPRRTSTSSRHSNWASRLSAASCWRTRLPAFAPRAQFFKQTYGANLSRPFKLAGQEFALQSTLSAQHSRDVLYGTEQFLVGGPFSVRGFRHTSIAGDSGFYWRNEVGMPIPLAKLFGDGAPPGVLRPYGDDLFELRGEARTIPGCWASRLVVSPGSFDRS